MTGAATADLARYSIHRLPGLAGDAGLEHGGGRGLHGLAHSLRHPHLWLPQGAVLEYARATLPCPVPCAGHPPVPRGPRTRDPGPGRGEAQRARIPHR